MQNSHSQACNPPTVSSPGAFGTINRAMPLVDSAGAHVYDNAYCIVRSVGFNKATCPPAQHHTEVPCPVRAIPGPDPRGFLRLHLGVHAIKILWWAKENLAQRS